MDQPTKESAHYAAYRWVEAVLKRHDLARGWSLMTEELRKSSVSVFANNLGQMHLIDEMARVPAPVDHPLWSKFGSWQIAGYLLQWDHLDLDNCGYASGQRPVTPDTEMVLFVDKGTLGPFTAAEGGEHLPAVGFEMWLSPNDGWLIQNFHVGEETC